MTHCDCRKWSNRGKTSSSSSKIIFFVAPLCLKVVTLSSPPFPASTIHPWRNSSALMHTHRGIDREVGRRMRNMRRRMKRRMRNMRRRRRNMRRRRRRRKRGRTTVSAVFESCIGLCSSYTSQESKDQSRQHLHSFIIPSYNLIIQYRMFKTS